MMSQSSEEKMNPGGDPLLSTGDGDDEKVCRICLEDDRPHQLIAPCRCKGFSRWVHRDCLDQWRATNPENLAFSRCGECLFEYHMEAVGATGLHRRAKYCLYVSRDICLTTILVQVMIGLFALFVWVVGEGQVLTTYMDCKGNNYCIFGTYYTVGVFLALVGLGIYGSILLCANHCSIDRAMDVAAEHSSMSSNRQRPHHSPRAPSTNQIEFRSQNADGQQGLRSAMARRPKSEAASSSRHSDCCNHCDVFCMTCSNCDGCDCVCCAGGCPHGASGSGGGSGGDGLPILLIVVAIVAVVFAVIGLFVGVFIAAVVLQRILQRHMFLLHKQRLTKEFRVRDLSGQLVDEDLERPDCPLLPPPPNLEEEHISHLQKLGLVRN